jgi:hypothetical protein
MNVKIHLVTIVHLIVKIPMVVLTVHVQLVLRLIKKLKPVKNSMVGYILIFEIFILINLFIDQSKEYFLILYDDNISLYNIWNLTGSYSSKPFKRIPIGKHHHFDRIQYDPNQMFLIYYDQDQHAMFCKSSITFQTVILLSNITVRAFAYNANEKTLFIIENQSQTFRIYTPITCEISHDIKMHSWSFNNHSNVIQSMEIDIYNRQFVFATQYDFLVSNMSEPNVTKIVYSTDREIKRFIYDATFKRIFWTTVNKTQEKLFLVHTCDNEFRRCLDTSVILPAAWPFAFFNVSNFELIERKIHF